MSKGSYYDILKVTPDASADVIASAYRTLMSKMKKHPDLGGDTEEAASINEAYETLSDPKRRKRYDATLSRRTKRKEKKPKYPKERRRIPRREVDAIVSFCVGHNQAWHAARVKDISVLGMRLQSHVPFKKGEHLVIAPSNLASNAFHGTVRWQRMFHPSTFERVYEAGIEFADQISDIDERLNS